MMSGISETRLMAGGGMEAVEARMQQIESMIGGVWLRVDTGALIDDAIVAIRDERTYEQLKNGVWTDLQLTAETGVGDKKEQILLNYENNRRTEYENYWKFRGMVEMVDVEMKLVQEGWKFFVDHDDKTYSLTDCISFVLMHKRGLAEALTFDRHYLQAGFRPVT